MDNLNTNQLGAIFADIKGSFAPFTDLFQSTSFLEGNVTAIRHFAEEALLNKPSSNMGLKERFLLLGKKAIHAVSSRFNFGALACKSALDSVICTVKAVAASVFNPSTALKHWRHAGVALYTSLNGLMGLISPSLASTSQLFFSATVLSIHGKNICEKANNLIAKVKDGIKAISEPKKPQVIN